MKRKTQAIVLILSIFLMMACSGALVNTIKDGDMNSFKAIVDKGGDINSRYRDLTPLMLAAHEGRPQMINYLLDKGAKINEQDSNGNTALHWAIYDIKPESAKTLINRGADINKPNSQGNRPIVFAAIYGNLETVKCLLEKGADINAKDEHGASILVLAAVHTHFDTFRYLLEEEKMDIKATDKYGNTALHLSCLAVVTVADNSATISMLIKSGLDKNSKNSLGDTPLMLAAIHGAYENANELIKNGVDLDIKNNNGKTALSYAQACAYNQPIDQKHKFYFWSFEPPNYANNCARIAELIKGNKRQ